MMIDTEIFKTVLPEDCILLNEKLSGHTTYKIGGGCDVLLKARNSCDIVNIIKTCNENKIPFEVMGNGSNLLISDKGIRGAVIKVSGGSAAVNGDVVWAQAGATLFKVAMAALEASLGGLEFSYGIPGTFGGAVCMNAGAYGGDMKRVMDEILVCDRQGNTFTIKKDDMKMSYRNSVIRQEGLIMLEGKVKLIHSEHDAVKKRMRELLERRKSMQPLCMPSCGSVFKRPEGQYIGKLIEEAGMKGARVGDAEVSALHANFIVNTGNAKAADVLALMELVRQRVKEVFGIDIEPEVIYMGEA